MPNTRSRAKKPEIWACNYFQIFLGKFHFLEKPIQILIFGPVESAEVLSMLDEYPLDFGDTTIHEEKEPFKGFKCVEKDCNGHLRWADRFVYMECDTCLKVWEPSRSKKLD
eukprot:g39279.t1